MSAEKPPFNKNLNERITDKNHEEKFRPSPFGVSGFKEGDQVTIRRSGGDLENDWSISGFSIFERTGEIVIEVKKPDPEHSGTIMKKRIRLKEFQELNPID